MGIDEMISKYKELGRQIRSFYDEKKVLEAQILNILPFNKDGQKTLETLEHKVCIKAGNYFRVVGAVEFLTENDLPNELNPFKQKISWELDKKKYEKLSAYPQYKVLVDDLIESVPKPIKLEVL